MIKKILMIICIAISVTTKAQEYIPNLEVETLNAFESTTTDTLTVRKQLISLLPTGTAPFIVSSTNKVVNLNVDRLDSMSSEDFPLKTTANVYSGIQSYSTGFTFDNDRQIVDKAYVDAVATGNMPKLPVDVATTTNITLSGIQTIDSYLVSEGQRVLVNNQSTQSENGVYIVDSAIWARSSDLDTWVELYKAYVAVLNGGQSGSSFICNIPSTGTLESDPITWVLYTSSTNIMAGEGLTKIGNTLSANYGGTGIAITISRSDHTQNFSTITNTPTLTINGTGYDLSSNRTWNVGTVTSISAGLGLSGGMITSSGTILLDTASTSVLSRQRAANTYQPIGSYLTSEVDGSTTNEIQDLSRSNDTLYLSLDATPVILNDFQKDSDTLTFDATLSDLQDSASAIRALANTKAVVSGTDNYIMKKTGANTLGNSSIVDNGSTVKSTLPIQGASLYAGTSLYANGYIELGYGQTGNRNTVIDFTSDDTYTDYGLRMIRFNTGADAFSALYHRGKGDFAFVTQEAAPITFTTKSTTAVVIDTLQNSGFGTLTPAARIHSLSTGTQARLGYNANKYTDLSTGSTGDLTITPSGGDVIVAGDIVGDSIRAANFKMSTGAGKNKVMMSDSFGNGYWAEALGVPKVGDYYGGGQVYYVSPSGTYGYCVYPSVIATNTYWSPTNNNAAIATNQAVGAGIANTTAIVATFGAGNYAAYKVDTLNIGGYSDWALPSIGDADLIHDSLYSTFPTSNPTFYLCSNDWAEFGYMYYWFNGTTTGTNKGTSGNQPEIYGVIAVRRFVISTQSFNLAVAESDGSPNYSAINTIQFANSVLSQPASNTVLVTPNSMNGDQIVAALNANDSTTLTKALAAPQLIMTGTSYNYLWSQYYNNAYDYGIYLTQAPKGGYSDLLKFDAFNNIFYIPKLNLELGGYANNIGTGAATGSSTTKLATEDLVVKTIAASGGGGMVYPGAGIPVSTGSVWGTSKTAPSGTIVGTTDSQSLTNKSVNGVTLSTSAGTTNFLAGDGTYKASTYTLPIASSSGLGGVKVNGNGIAIDAGGVLFQEDNNLTVRTPILTDPIAFYDASATAQGKTTFAEIRTIMNGVQTLTSSSSITMNFATAPKATLSLATNGTITITNLPDGGEGSIEVTSSGAYTLAIAGSTGYTTTQKMGTTTSIANNSHTTVFYWRSGTILYYGFLLNN